MTTPTPQVLDPLVCDCGQPLRDKHGGEIKYHVCSRGGRWQKPRPPKARKGGHK